MIESSFLLLFDQFSWWWYFSSSDIFSLPQIFPFLRVSLPFPLELVFHYIFWFGHGLFTKANWMFKRLWRWWSSTTPSSHIYIVINIIMIITHINISFFSLCLSKISFFIEYKMMNSHNEGSIYEDKKLNKYIIIGQRFKILASYQKYKKCLKFKILKIIKLWHLSQPPVILERKLAFSYVSHSTLVNLLCIPNDQ